MSSSSNRFEPDANYVHWSIKESLRYNRPSDSESAEVRLRAHLKRFNHTAAVVSGLHAACLDPELEIFKPALDKMLRALPDEPTNEPMSFALRGYDENKRKALQICFGLCEEIGRIETQQSFFAQAMQDQDRTVTMLEGLRNYAGSSDLSDASITREALQMAAMRTDNHEAGYALEILSYFLPRSQREKPAARNFENVDRVTNHWRSSLADLGISVISLLPRAVDGPARQPGF